MQLTNLAFYTKSTWLIELQKYSDAGNVFVTLATDLELALDTFTVCNGID